MKYFRLSFYKYIFEKPESGCEPYLTVIICRLKGYAGEIFYNAGGLEPDHRCKNCLEIIG